MTSYRENVREEFRCAVFDQDADADDVEPYRSLVLKRNRLAARLIVIKQELLTGGRKCSAPLV